MSTAHAHHVLLARLRRVTNTAAGNAVQELQIETNSAGQPKLIRGILLEPGANGMRRVPCSWLPNGRHRLYPNLNIIIPAI